jgi:GNAT superfamily N-acetyltransferase
MQEILENGIEGFRVRFAQEEDSAELFAMVRELAEYEKLLGCFEATEQLIRKALFERHIAEALIAEFKGEAVGYAVFFYNFSTFVGRPGIYIEDIYVKPKMRGRGFGKSMFSFIAKLAVERNCGRLEWACLDWNAPSIAFYKKMSAAEMDEWTLYRLTGKALENVARD